MLSAQAFGAKVDSSAQIRSALATLGLMLVELGRACSNSGSTWPNLVRLWAPSLAKIAQTRARLPQNCPTGANSVQLGQGLAIAWPEVTWGHRVGPLSLAPSGMEPSWIIFCRMFLRKFPRGGVVPDISLAYDVQALPSIPNLNVFCSSAVFRVDAAPLHGTSNIVVGHSKNSGSQDMNVGCRTCVRDDSSILQAGLMRGWRSRLGRGPLLMRGPIAMPPRAVASWAMMQLSMHVHGVQLGSDGFRARSTSCTRRRRRQGEETRPKI